MNKLLTREFDISQQKCTKLINRFRDFESHNFKNLERLMRESKYAYRAEWGSEPRDKYPRILVFATLGMLENYVRFGDLLAFDITYGILRNVSQDNRRYRVGVFTVKDTNLRMLLAGIAIMVDETTQALFTIFDFFLQIHGKPPSSIITDDQNTIALAINELKVNQFFQGNHMLDPWHLLKSIRPSISENEKEKTLKLGLIMDAITERNPYDFYKLMAELRKDDSTKEVIEILERRKSQIFYIEAEASFIGLRRNNCEAINDLIKRQVPLEVTIDQFMIDIDQLDGKLREKSAQSFDAMREQLDKLFLD